MVRMDFIQSRTQTAFISWRCMPFVSLLLLNKNRLLSLSCVESSLLKLTFIVGSGRDDKSNPIESRINSISLILSLLQSLQKKWHCITNDKLSMIMNFGFLSMLPVFFYRCTLKPKIETKKKNVTSTIARKKFEL